MPPLREAHLFARSPRRAEGHHTRGRQRLLLQQHPPQRHRGGRQPAAESIRATRRSSKDLGARDHRFRLAPGALRRSPATPPQRGAVRARRRSRHSSTSTWAASTALSCSTLPAAAPRRARAKTARLTGPPFPRGGRRGDQAARRGVGTTVAASASRCGPWPSTSARTPTWQCLQDKRGQRARDEEVKTLNFNSYRKEDAQCAPIFFRRGPQLPTEARRRFVHKLAHRARSHRRRRLPAARGRHRRPPQRTEPAGQRPPVGVSGGRVGRCAMRTARISAGPCGGDLSSPCFPTEPACPAIAGAPHRASSISIVSAPRPSRWWRCRRCWRAMRSQRGPAPQPRNR